MNQKIIRNKERIVFYLVIGMAYIVQTILNTYIDREMFNIVDVVCFLATALNFEYVLYQEFKPVNLWLTFGSKLILWMVFFLLISNIIALIGELFVCRYLWRGSLVK